MIKMHTEIGLKNVSYAHDSIIQWFWIEIMYYNL